MEAFWQAQEWEELMPDTVRVHLRFHTDNARYSQRVAQALDAGVLVVSAAIPTAAAIGASRVVLGVLGALVTVLTGLGHQHRWKENWIRHVRSRVAIEQELVRYKNRGQPYDAVRSVDARRALLALNVEDIAQADAAIWATRAGREEPPKDTVA